MLGIFVLSACGGGKEAKKELNPEEAKKKVEDFINKNLMRASNKATVKEIVDEGNLYKVAVDVGSGQDVESYLSKDGEKFFPQVMNIKEVEKETQDREVQTQKEKEEQAKEMSKKTKPDVELYVMSHCPFGTQIEKGFLPVAETLGDKINYEVKFCDYAMHGEKEVNEQLLQYCIQKEQKDKYLPYLKCFLVDGKTDDCKVSVSLDLSKLDSCMKSADQEFKITESLNDKSKWKGQFPNFDIHKADNEKYGIQGSPGLVINGQKVSSGRDAKSLLEIICSGFEVAPEECKKELSSETPSSGFGFNGGGGNDTASCN